MKSSVQAENFTRESVLKLLSDEEVAKVSTAEAATRLLDGEEYLDLEHLDRGVQRAEEPATGMGGVLPRRTVHKETWSKILMRLGNTTSEKDTSYSKVERAKLISPL